MIVVEIGGSEGTDFGAICADVAHGAGHEGFLVGGVRNSGATKTTPRAAGSQAGTLACTVATMNGIVCCE
jgi:hypothetical protein